MSMCCNKKEYGLVLYATATSGGSSHGIISGVEVINDCRTYPAKDICNVLYSCLRSKEVYKIRDELYICLTASIIFIHFQRILAATFSRVEAKYEFFLIL